nr:MAG TPA: hypothetical protein [Caudoviricetes sp.]
MLNIGNAFKVSYRRASSLTLMSSYYDFNSQSLTLILRLLGKRKPRKQDKPASGVPSTPTNKCSPSPWDWCIVLVAEPIKRRGSCRSAMLTNWRRIAHPKQMSRTLYIGQTGCT